MLVELSCGELVLDLLVEESPVACRNFLKLCKLKYYNGNLLYNVQADYIVQTGDPTATGRGGRSVYGLLGGADLDCFADEIVASRSIDRAGLVCMANSGKPNTNKSQFFITLGNEQQLHLEGKHTVFAEVAEGSDVLALINGVYCDEDGRPFQDIRIKHTHVLDDPFDDPPGLVAPPQSPELSRPKEEKVSLRIPYEEDLEEGTDARTQQELDESIKRKEAHSRAIVLEMTGDIPDADIRPPAEVLFVAKLNPVTTDAELELIFSRFGTIKLCEIIRDSKTGDSLNYAFIEFEAEESCIEAYNKMNNVLIDDRRIKVDFSQSVSKLWNKFFLKPKTDKRFAGSVSNDVSVPGRSSHAASTSAGRGAPSDARSGDHYGGGRGGGGAAYEVRKRVRSRSRSRERRPADRRQGDRHGRDRGGPRDEGRSGERSGERSDRSRDRGRY